MQKHAIALGYFFLAVCCIYVSQHGPAVFYPMLIPMLVTAGALACLAGAVFFLAASIEQLQAGKQFLAKWIRKAQQPPA